MDIRFVNNYPGETDSDRIDNALKDFHGGEIIFEPRQCDIEPERTHWLLDRAVLLPSDTIVTLWNCRLKLSDRCRDNFFRSANCGIGIDEIEPLSNIHIQGKGFVVLEGADHPRACGDGTKVLKCPCPKTKEDIVRLADWVPEERRAVDKLNFWDEHICSYGTDAGKEGESQYGDWRGIGILFAMVDHFSVSGLKIVEPHGWGMSFEACSHGFIDKIDFDAMMAREIDGLLQNTENQDGIDIRNGCHDITITNISGGTGDDLIALTAIADDSRPVHPCGAMRSTHVMHNDWSRRERDIYNIIIRNVMGYSKGGICYTIRLLPGYSRIYNVVIDGVIDTRPEGWPIPDGGILLGCPDGEYGKNLPDGMKNIAISNVIMNSRECVLIQGYISDSVITNVTTRNPKCAAVIVSRKNGVKNVSFSNLNSPTGCGVYYKRG